MLKQVDQFFLNQEESNSNCFLALRQLIFAADSQVSETMKYNMPCYCYQNKAFCYLWQDKKTREPYILFVEGNQMNHPELESGDRSRMKIFRVDPHSDLPKSTINSLLTEAISLAKNQIKK